MTYGTNTALSIVIGTAGHIDHGKSSLVQALTGKDPDRLPEEKRRGITIDLGFADLDLGDVRVGFVDVPGHERFVKNMLAGVHGIGAVALVIAADEGVMPQTREHFDICRLLNVRKGLVVITKTDLVEEELLALVRAEAEELVAGSFLEGAPTLSVSARTGEGLEELRSAIRQIAGETPMPSSDSVTRLAHDPLLVPPPKRQPRRYLAASFDRGVCHGGITLRVCAGSVPGSAVPGGNPYPSKTRRAGR